MTAAAPARSAWTLSSTVSRVDRAPVPATTGTRPAAASAVTSITWRRSSCVSVVNSPVLPPGTSPPAPAPTRRSTIAASASESTAPPSSVNGVMSAGRTPWKSGMVDLGSEGGRSFAQRRLDALGGHRAGAGGGLHVPQLGEVAAGEVQVAAGAERALERRLQAVAARPGIDVPVRPAVHGGAGDRAAGLGVELVQVGEEAPGDVLVALAHQLGGGRAAREQHQAAARPALALPPQHVGLVG